jgi:monoamine oxidase
VVVVGAGLAGMSAARDLTKCGCDVVVLEARDRVGGRVWSKRLENGEIVELGGEWIASGQDSVLGLAAELGLTRVDPGIDFVTRDAVGGEIIPVEEHRRVNRALGRLVDSLSPKDVETMAAAALVDQVDDGSPAFRVLRSRLEGTCGAPLEVVAGSEIVSDFGYGEHSYYRIEGGNDSLAIVMASSLEVKLDSVVTAVAQSRRGVVLEVDRREVDADAVVVAVPLPVLRRINFDPGFPEPLALAVARTEMGTAAKLAIGAGTAPPLFRRQDTDIPAWYWSGLAANGDVRRAVTGFAGSSAGVDSLLKDPLSRVRAAVPETELLGDPVIVDWGADEFAAGCYSVIGPGQRPLLRHFEEPWGRVFLAGEHTRGSGSIDGAVASGRAAASRVVAAGRARFPSV